MRLSSVSGGDAAAIARPDRLGSGEVGPDAGDVRTDVHALTIHEVFLSIQGESTHAGRPCVFVRLTACDLRCTWCDTTYAFHEGRTRSVADVIGEVERYDTSLVEITGGEPLLQPHVYALMDRLLASGRTVLLETGGHIGLERVPPAVIKIVDVKCPASGESHRNDWTNVARLTDRDEVKFVIQDRADYEFARAAVREHGLDRRAHAVLFSPVHGVLHPRVLAEWILADGLPVRLQIQLHKYLWGADARGV